MDMNGKDYERHAAGYLRLHGFRHVKLTGNSGDYGVDIVATRRMHRYAVQCKFYSKPVGVAAIQQVVGGMAYYNCDRALVITNSTFTRQARQLAETNGVMLLDNIRSSGKLRRVLLIILYYLALTLMLFTGYRYYAVGIMALSLIITAFILYLRHQAVNEKRQSQE